tara:strand:- start:465 stop:971 length:507 start_codon:yes stop_codon:yes gene_type:complete
MEIIAALAEGKRSAIAGSSDVAHYVVGKPEAVGLLIEALSSSDAIVAAHAAHACLSVFKACPDRLLPYRKTLLAVLHQRDQWELIEQLTKIVPQLGCTDEEQKSLSRRLMDVVGYGTSSIARTCALQGLVDLASIDEFYETNASQAIAYALENGTKAMKARARKLQDG